MKTIVPLKETPGTIGLHNWRKQERVEGGIEHNLGKKLYHRRIVSHLLAKCILFPTLFQINVVFSLHNSSDGYQIQGSIRTYLKEVN